MKKRRSTEQIVGLLRQADVDLGKGMNVPDVCRRLGVSQQTYYRWLTETGDQGAESDAMYDSDMKVYVGKGMPEVEANIATMKRWAAEGR
jgi:transposase